MMGAINRLSLVADVEWGVKMLFQYDTEKFSYHSLQ